MREQRIHEVILCDTGCGRRAGETGFCSMCLVGLEEASLEGLWNFETHRRPCDLKPRTRVHRKPTSWKHVALAALVVVLFLYFAFEELVPVANEIAGGWRPWMQ